MGHTTSAGKADAEKLKLAFSAYNTEVRISATKVAFILVMILLPIGVTLDYFVYPALARFFLGLRFISAVVAFLCWAAMASDFGRRNFRIMCMGSFLLPSVCIDLMIYFSEGADSPYYAGLNLLLIGIVWVAQIEFSECLIASALTVILYEAACFAHGGGAGPSYFNNYYFILLNCFIVSIGCFSLSKLRFQEFALRSQLDSSRQELEQTNAKLVELDRAKSTFFANVSHELRTPLTLLIGPLDRLRRRDPQQTTHERVEMLDIMYNNAMRLLRLINDLLDLVRLDSGGIRVRREKVELIPFLEGIAKSVSPMASQRKLHFESRFEPEAGTLVWIDRDKVEKIILNLLFNAFKFTPENGRVDFGATLHDGRLAVTVRDTGKGIGAADLPRIFDRFWQVESAATRNYQGVGIGLALVKELTEAHGGVAEAASELGKGTEMRVTIDARDTGEGAVESPFEAAAPAPVNNSEWLEQLYRRAELFPSHVMEGRESENAPQQPGAGKPAVLVADDEPEMRRFLMSQLKGIYAIHEARNGSEALELARSNEYVLILLDLMMPGIDGITLTRLLREESKTASVPIVMLTARADDDSKMQALEAGVTDFLTKPFSTSEMAVRCRNLVLQEQLKRKLAARTRELEEAIQQIKETETQMVHQAKMASLGQLSSGLLHEINNPLNFANTAVHILRKRFDKMPAENTEAMQAPLRDLQDGIKRAADIVGSLRSFTHPDTSNFESVGLKEVVDTAVRFVQVAASEIALEIGVPEEARVWGNRNQLIHLLINLLQNASDSLMEKGAPEKKIKVFAVLQNGSVLLSCEDNGKGIKSEDRSKVFDAFFTTKPVGAGVGLGLNICHRIVQNHRGAIRVESQENEFCRFQITLNRNPSAPVAL